MNPSNLVTEGNFGYKAKERPF